MFEDYIYSLDINTLRALILEIAPDDFRKKIGKEYQKTKRTQKVNKDFDKLKNAFSVIFEDEINLYIINNFERHVSKVCQALRPYWVSKETEIGDMITKFILNVGDALNDNYLSEENYHFDDDRIYEGEDFAKYIAEFIAYIPPNKRQAISQKIIKAQKEVANYFSVFENLEAELQKVIPDGKW